MTTLERALSYKVSIDYPQLPPILADLPFPLANASLTSANLTTNATFAAEALEEYHTNQTGPYAIAGSNIVGYIPLVTCTNGDLALQQEAASQDPSMYLAPNTPADVVQGYAALHNTLTERLSSPNSALVEIGLSDGRVGISLQQPFSRGSVQAVSSSTFDPPIVDPRSLHNPLDVSLIVEALKFARTLVQTNAMAELSAVETNPGANVTSDEDLAAYVREVASPAWHLGGTCKMGDRENGGVVDEQLRVHGVDNLRVVDASVMPLLPAAHTMATVYSIAEKVRSSVYL
jgi:hypothetical protein